MSLSFRRACIAVAFAALPLAPAALVAQAAPAAAPAAAADSLAFPRQFVTWVFSGKGDSAYAHAGPQLRDAMKSAQGVNTMASNIFGRFGAMDGTDAEVQFDDGPLKVYIAALKFSDAPEPGGFIIAYSTDTHLVERAAFTALSRLKARYPQAKLP